MRAIHPWLFNVYLQKPHAGDGRPSADGDVDAGKVMSTLRPLDAPGGIDFVAIFEGMRAIGYDGCVTMHQAFGGDMTAEEATRRTAAFLQGVII